MKTGAPVQIKFYKIAYPILILGSILLMLWTPHPAVLVTGTLAASINGWFWGNLSGRGI